MADYIEDRDSRNGRGSSGLSIAGLVIGILSLIFSLIPCIGTMALFPAIVGLILSILGYRQDKEMNTSTTMGISGIVLTSIAILFSGFQSFAFGTIGSDVASGMDIEVANCEEILTQFEKVAAEFEAINNKNEEEIGMSDVTKILKSVTKVAAYKKKATEMGCDDDPEFTAKMDAIADRIGDDK